MEGKTSKERFREEFSLKSKAGCGVTLVRAREPHRAAENLREIAYGLGIPFSVWDIVQGWTTWQISDAPGSEQRHKLLDAYAALKWIEDVDGEGKSPRGDGLFVMSGVHPWLGKHPGMIECVRQYVRALSEKPRTKLVLLVPETETLPDDLAHDVPVLDFSLPSPDEVGEILDYVVESSTPKGEAVPVAMFSRNERETIIASGSGLTRMEAELAFSEAIVRHSPKGNGRKWHEIGFEQFNGSVLASKTEIVRQSKVLSLKEPVPMSEVGGLDILKEWVKTAALAFTPEAAEFGVDAPKGIACVGPPGTGKTLVGMAIATYFGQPLVLFDVSKCYGSLVGESEKLVRVGLNQVEAMGRVVVLFDEMDKTLGGAQHNSGDSGVSKRILSAILTFLALTKAPVFPIFTANRCDTLPPELLRKGRLDNVFAVMPPNRIEREAIFRIHLRKRKQDPDAIGDLCLAIRASRGYVSAELEAGVKEAVKHAFVQQVPVTGALIARMLGGMRPIAEAFPEDFARMSEWAANNATLASSPSEEEQGEPVLPKARRRSISNN